MGHNIYMLMGISAGVIRSQDGLYLSFYFSFPWNTVCTMCKKLGCRQGSVVIEREKLYIELWKIYQNAD